MHLFTDDNITKEDSNTLSLTEMSDEALTLEFYSKETDLARLWHNRLAHQNHSVLEKMNETYDLKIPKYQIHNIKNCACDVCILSKGRKTKIGNEKSEQFKVNDTMVRLHCDLIGPISFWDGKFKQRVVTTIGGNLYGLIVLEEKSRYPIVKLLKFKDEATEHLINIAEELQVKTQKKLQEIHFDGGGEFVNNELKSYASEKGIKLTYTTAYTPEHNGMAERMNGLLIEMARSMLTTSSAPLNLWGEALVYSAFIYSNITQPVINYETPSEVLFGNHYSPDKIRTFGCDAYLYIENNHRGKFEPRFKRGVFVGFDTVQNGYRIYDPEVNKLTVSRNVKFVENSFKFINQNYEEDLYSGENNINIINNSVSAPTTIIQSNKSSTLVPQDMIVSEVNDDTHDIEEKDNDPVIDTNLSHQPLPTIEEKDEYQQDESVEEKKNEETQVTQLPMRVTPAVRKLRKSLTDSLSKKFIPSNYISRRVSGIVTRSNHVYPKPLLASIFIDEEIFNDLTNIDLDYDSNQTDKCLLLPILLALPNDDDNYEPNTFKQAIRCKQSDKWNSSMQEELKALENNRTWEIVPRPKNESIISSRWVFKIKLDNNNKPVRFKSRLVARGFQQQQGVNYDETFAPVVKMKSIKLVLSLAASRDMELQQIDFDTAYLNATLQHTVYMELPDGSNYPKGTVCKLLKSLYGLKQAGHDWNELLRDLLIKLGYKQLQCDKCVFIKYTTSSRFIILLVYVDDTISAYDKIDEAIWLKDKETISQSYKIKDIGNCEWILNMKVTRDRVNKIITLSQEAYIKRILETFRQDQCNSLNTPSSDIDLYKPPDGSDVTPLNTQQQRHYQQIIGSLLYAALTTRIDIAFAVNELGRFNSQANQCQLQQAFRVLRYLKGTSNYGLQFKLHGDPMDIKPEIYVDASWGNDLETRRSTSGMVATFNNNIVSWNVKKQASVAKSSTEAEYVAASDAVAEALWMRSWMKEIFNKDLSITMYCDNQSAIALSKNDTFHQRTKHIDIKYHFIRENVANGFIKIVYVPTKEQLADILTKHLVGKNFLIQRNKLVIET
jgi:hypothetical protein